MNPCFGDDDWFCPLIVYWIPIDTIGDGAFALVARIDHVLKVDRLRRTVL